MDDDKLDELLELTVSMVNDVTKGTGYIAAMSIDMIDGRGKTQPTFSWEYTSMETLFLYAEDDLGQMFRRREIHIFKMGDEHKDIMALNDAVEYFLINEEVFHTTQSGKKLKAKRWKKLSGKDIKHMADLGLHTTPFYVFTKKNDIFPAVKKKADAEKEARQKYLFRRQKFTGDIIITDPCYVCRKHDKSGAPQWKDFHPYKSICDYPDYDKETKMSEQFKINSEKLNAAYEKWDADNPDDWDDFEEAMEREGIVCLMHRTLVGDWDCIVIDDKDDIIGRFGADSGEVGVFLLDDVLRYNSQFDSSLIDRGLAAVLKDFDGEIWLEKQEPDLLMVRGKGTLQKEPFQFRTEPITNY